MLFYIEEKYLFYTLRKPKSNSTINIYFLIYVIPKGEYYEINLERECKIILY